jgi:MFS transporter, DHA1 family, inner membrane transport protein
MKSLSTVSPAGLTDAATDRRTVFCIPLALGMASFLSALVFVAPPPLFPSMSRELGISVPALGQVVAVMLFVAAALSLVIGPLADRHGLRRLLIIGSIAAAACMLGFGLAPSYSLLLGAALFGGLANATLPGLSLAVARSSLHGEARQRAIGWTSAGGAITAIAAVPLMALLAGVVGWRGAFSIAAIVAACMATFLAYFLPRDVTSSGGARSLLTAYAPLIRHRPTMRIYGVTILRSVCWFGLLGYFGAFMVDHLGLNGTWVGLAYMLSGTGYVIGSLTAGHILTMVPARMLIGLTNVVLGIAVGLIFGVVQGPAGAVVLLTVAGFMGAFSHIGTVTLLSTEAPGGSGTIMVLNGALTNLGAAGGGAIGGLLLATGGFGALGFGLATVALLTVTMLVRTAAPVATPAPLEMT